MTEIIRRDAPTLQRMMRPDGTPCCHCEARIAAGQYAIREWVQLAGRGIAAYYWHPACWQHAEESGALPGTVADHADR